MVYLPLYIVTAEAEEVDVLTANDVPKYVPKDVPEELDKAERDVAKAFLE